MRCVIYIVILFSLFFTTANGQKINAKIEVIPLSEFNPEPENPKQGFCRFCGTQARALKVRKPKDTLHELRDKYRKAKICDSTFDRFSWIHAPEFDKNRRNNRNRFVNE